MHLCTNLAPGCWTKLCPRLHKKISVSDRRLSILGGSALDRLRKNTILAMQVIFFFLPFCTFLNLLPAQGCGGHFNQAMSRAQKKRFAQTYGNAQEYCSKCSGLAISCFPDTWQHNPSFVCRFAIRLRSSESSVGSSVDVKNTQTRQEVQSAVLSRRHETPAPA